MSKSIARDIYNLYRSRADEVISKQEFDATLDSYKCAGALTMNILVSADDILRAEDSIPSEYSLRLRKLHLKAAEASGIYVVKGDAAHAVALSSFSLGDDEIAIRYWLEALQAYLSAHTFPVIPPLVRNIGRALSSIIDDEKEIYVDAVETLIVAFKRLCNMGCPDDIKVSAANVIAYCIVDAHEHELFFKYRKLRDFIAAIDTVPMDSFWKLSFYKTAAMAALSSSCESGDMDMVLGQKEAWLLCSKARSVALQSDEKDEIAKTSRLLAMYSVGLYSHHVGFEEQVSEGIMAGEQALEYYNPQQEPEKHRKLLNILGLLYANLGQHDISIDYFERYCKMTRCDDVVYFGACVTYATYCATHGSIFQVEQSEKVLEEMLSGYDGCLNESDQFILAQARYQLARRRKDWHAAEKHALKQYDSAGDANMRTLQADAMAYYGDALLCQGRKHEAISAYNEAVEIAEREWVEAKPRIDNTAFAKMTSHLATQSAYQRMFYKKLSSAYDEVGEYRSALETLERGRGRLMTEIARHSDASYVNTESAVLSKIQVMMKEHADTACVVFSFAAKELTCYVVMGEKDLIRVSVSRDERELVNKLLYLHDGEIFDGDSYYDTYLKWRRTGSNGCYRRFLNAIDVVSKQIGRLLFAPILERVPELLNVKRLVIVPDNWIATLPLQCAVLPSGEYLVDFCDLVHVPSLRSLIHFYSIASHPDTYVFSSQSAQNVPMIPLEIAEIGDIVQSHPDVFGGDRFVSVSDMSELRSTLSKARNVWLHIAAHMKYEYGASGEQASIVFKDEHGKSEYYALDVLLSESHLALPSGSVVVLSGCESVGFDLQRIRANVEPFNLAYAFLAAGASSVVGASWAVSDLATFVLMRRCYKELVSVKDGDIASALTRAQRWLKSATTAEVLESLPPNAPVNEKGLQIAGETNENVFSHPYFWGGWNCVGYWRTHKGGADGSPDNC